MPSQTAISRTQPAPVQDVYMPDELIGSARLGAEYPDASPSQLDTIIRVILHSVVLLAIMMFVFYCWWLTS